MIAKQILVGVAMAVSHSMWLIMLTRIVGDHTPNFGLIGLLIGLWQQNNFSGCGYNKKQSYDHTHMWQIMLT